MVNKLSAIYSLILFCSILSATFGDFVRAFSCNFDSSYCGWTNDNRTDFTWTRTRGETHSKDTGPPWDHTTKDANDGSYVYIETSSPRQMGDKARLISPVLTTPGTYCLRFWHHMHGADVKDLNVYVKDIPTKRLRTVAHLSGAWSVQGPAQARVFGRGEDWWNEHQTEFATTAPVNIIIEGVRGENYRGDIAVDDVTLTDSRCTGRPIDCDFENNTCGWIQMSGDDFNWLPNKAETPTRYTGPSADHTLGTTDGRYLYIEASWPRAEGDRARLLSPPISCSADAQPVFRFWYNMNGAAIGPLRMYLVTDETEVLGEPVWQISGEQGPYWLQAEFSIPQSFIQSTDKFNIIIEAERQDYRGDIAIDDVSLIGCHPNSTSNVSPLANDPREHIPTSTLNPSPSFSAPSFELEDASLPENLSCSFDGQNLCAWSDDINDDFDWTLNQGKTHSFRTGPLFDHTTRSGWYIFMEASLPRILNDKAMLRSPPISSTIRSCLRFYYHMYGETMGRLEVLTSRSGRTRFYHKWSADGEQSFNETDWRFAEVDITESFNYEIIFRGIRGDNFYSDIAIDDISVSPAPCYSSPPQVTSVTHPTQSPLSPGTPTLNSSLIYERINCNFDLLTTCSWNQLNSDNFDWTVSSNGRTPSPSTGPDSDHTGGGQFAYIEASKPRRHQDRSRLESQTFTILSPVCFSMWYHMRGTETGSLTLYKVPYNRLLNGTAQPNEEAVWSISGDRGDEWKLIQLTLNNHGDTRIIIEATRGDGWRSDIAIDDISLEAGECPIFNCSFDTGMCGWTQEPLQDDFDWTRTNIESPTTNTGPQYDHTHKNPDGYYLYIETSSPRKQGDIARLVSPEVTTEGSPNKCLKFWYHSYGSHIGSLNVYKRNLDHVGTYLGTPLWYQGEHEGDQWLHASINVEDNLPYQIIFEGVRGTRYRGDISIDDVTISNGACQSCCGDDFFRCGNNLCVSSEVKCDGVDDCGDFSDESFCQGCGTTSYQPRTSPSFGLATELGMFQIVSPPVGAHRYVPNNDNGTSKSDATTNTGGPEPRRVVKLTLNQLRLIRPGLEWGILEEPYAAAGSDELIPIESDFLSKAEVINVRKRRNVRHPSDNTSVLAKLMRGYVSSKNTTPPVYLRPNQNSTKTTATVDLPTHETLKWNKSKDNQIDKQTTEPSPQEETEDGENEEQRVFRPRRPTGRWPELIPTWQWLMTRKSLNRDKEGGEEEEEEEEQSRRSLSERIKRAAVPQLRITGGDETVPHSWPWQAAYYVTDSLTRSHYFCGATLIERYWVITAAHCPQLGDVHSVILGDHDLYEDEGTEQEMKVEAVYVNQEYRFSEDLVGDIALVKLRYPARTTAAVQPACLLRADDERFEPGHGCAITGWGRTNADAPLVERILRQGEVPLLSHELCQSTFWSIYNIYDSMVCAGGTGSNTCRGDSGGPLICERNNRHYLVGITSWGDTKCNPDIPGVYTRVQSYMGWLNRIMNQDTCTS